MKLKKTLLAIVLGASAFSMSTVALSASKSGYSSSSRSSMSSSSSRSSSSYSSSRSSSSSSSSPTKSSSSSTSASSSYKPSSSTVYRPVTSSNSVKTAPYKQESKKSVPPIPATAAAPVKKTGTSYSDLKKKKYEQKSSNSNFLSWVLLAWILSDSSKSTASSSTTKEIVVDCKQWLKDNEHKSKDTKQLSDKEFMQIKEYCEKVAK
ncbi:hypothetical protein [Acinetobacter baumannii]|uniref:hypothetical protein n=1 Tax=Acinetobacter baumannii TaxID=470 RepID=UPI0036F96BBD